MTVVAPGPARRDGTGRLALLAVLAGALGLRLYHLGARSVWADEGSTWTAAASSFGALVRRCAEREESPPLYYLLTSLALRLGQGEVQLRLVSALASVLLVWATYRFARLFAGRGEATLAAALLAVSPFQIMYAQEARAYVLVALFTVGALYFFARAVLLGRPRAWLPYVVVSALGLWTQSIALLGAGVQAVVVLVSPAARRRLVPWFRAQLIVAALYLPWILASWGRGAGLDETHWYLGTPGPHGLAQVVRALFVAPGPIVTPEPGTTLPGLGAWLPRPLAWLLLAVLVGVPFVRALGGLAGAAPRGPLLRLTLAGLLLPPAAVLAVSPWVPLWLPRFFVFLSPMIVVLLAHGLGCLRPRALGVAWSALLVLMYLFGVAHYDRDQGKEDWRGVVGHIATASAPASACVLVLFDLDPFAFYDSRLPLPLPAFEVSHAEVPFSGHLTPAQLDETAAAARSRTAGFDEVWVVSRSLTSESRRELTRRADGVAAEGRTLVEDQTWQSAGGPVFARHYRRTGTR
jgi:4-amino-4-deoxy-L-arabinose transferase-like glycosyltransferase